MTRAVTATLLALALAGAGATTRAADPEWDAKFVKVEAPKTVTADAVFAVKITMRNTGTQTWKEGRDLVACSLRAQEPDNNTRWGTSYIIQGQGVVVAPGKDCTFTSNLRAPSEPGKHSFRWRVQGKPGLFGETTEKLEIEVTARASADDKQPPIPADNKGKKALRFEDFEYLGSFKVPEVVGKAGAGYSEVGLALRPVKGAAPRVLLNYTHPTGMLFEADVPELGKFEKGDASKLKTAKVTKEWGALVSKDKKYGANGGFMWDEAGQKLYWTCYNAYWTGGDLPVLHATKLSDAGAEPVGSWTVPRQKWHWGGVTRLPKSFADAYTGGRTVGLGFGGYYSIVAPCSRGPALGAIADPDPAKGSVGTVTQLLGYPEGTAAPRPGDYFNANCTFWGDQPKSRATGMWSFDDHCRAGVLIDLPDRAGYIAFAKLGTGRLGYDYGNINCAGTAQCWYFYDALALGAAAAGDRKPQDTVPYLVRPEAEFVGTATGACFDEATRTLYVLRRDAHPVGREFHPLVHAYKVKQ